MRFCIETLGCKVNQYETQAMEALLASRGHIASRPGEGCDAVIVNTCAVTAESCKKSLKAIRRLKKLEPGALVAVCGCLSQVDPEGVEALGASVVGGSGDRHAFVLELERVVATGEKKSVVGDPKSRRSFEELPAGNVSGRTRALLKIEDGCQNYCAYCIIPHARGPVRSLEPEKAAAEAARLYSEGFKEIVVTGIEISSYGVDLGLVRLIDAVREISAAAPGARVRLGSLEPRTITEEFVEEIKKLPNVCRHFHISLQSGCDRTLRRMGRRYTADEALAAVQMLKESFPLCGVTADLIVGFPGETDDEFEETLDFIRRCAFSSMHVFPFSRRPGTPAAGMPDQVEGSVKRRRARAARTAARQMAEAFASSCVGEVLDVLFESEEGSCSRGRAGNYMEVLVKRAGLRNVLLPVRVTSARGRLLFGEIAGHDADKAGAR